MSPRRNGAKPVIGLIGSIGAGKTAAARTFAAHGGAVIDADALGHEALEQPEIRQRLLERWAGRGNLVKPDGRLDRRAIARIVFVDRAELRALEDLVFPYIGKRALEEIERAQSRADAKFVVLDAAVMLEAGWSDACDRIVYIDAPREARLARLAARSGWSDADLAGREVAQWPAETKMKHADAVIVNDSGLDKLHAQVDQLLEQWGIAGEEPRAAR
jgi:dephospho-CoA kinase